MRAGVTRGASLGTAGASGEAWGATALRGLWSGGRLARSEGEGGDAEPEEHEAEGGRDAGARAGLALAPGPGAHDDDAAVGRVLLAIELLEGLEDQAQEDDPLLSRGRGSEPRL